MRGVRWLLAAVAILLAATLAGVWLLPSVLDWNRYRDVIAALVSDRIGRPVRIEGKVTLSLLPQPVLTAGRISLAGEPGGGPGGSAQGGGGITATAAELRLRVALGPLLAGRIDAQDLVLRGLDMRVPWRPGPGSPGLAALVARTPSWLAALSARIEHGRLTIGQVAFTDINATLTTSDDTGSYFVAGTAGLSGHGWHFTARLTRPGGDGAAGLDLSLDGQGKMVGLGATFAGQIGPDGTLTGRVAGRGPDLSQVLPAPAVPFRAEGRVNVADGLAVADQLAGEIGGSPTSGAVALRLEPQPRLDVAMTASRLDLDAWAPALLRAASGSALRVLPIGIDLSAEAAQLGGGTLRRVRAAFDVADGVVVVREAHALLPGDATLRMTGRILPPNAPPAGVRFDGTASVWAPALRTTLAWAAQGKAGAGERLPALVLRSAQVSGHVVADAGQVSVDQLRGALDGGAVSGALSVRLGARPQVQARLSLDRLDLDPWLPTQLPTPAALTARLGGVQAELKVEARQALLRGVTLAPLSLDLGIDMGRLALRQLDFKADGVRGTLSGTLLDGGRIADGRLDLHADAATPLARLLPDWVPGWLPGLSAALHGGPTEGAMLATLLHAPLWRSPAGLQVQASGTAEAMNLRLAGEVGDLKLDAQPTLDLSGPAWRWTGPVTLRHPGAPRLAASLGLAAAPGWLGDGSLSLVAQVTADPARVAVDSFNLTAGGLHATGALSLDRAAAGGPMLAGRVAADTLPLPLPAPQAADPLPLAALTGWQASVRLEAAHVLAGNTPVLDRLATTVSLSGGTLRLEGLTAQLGGGELSGTASLDGQANPPVLAAQASLTGAMLAGPLLDDPFDLTAGTVDASATLAASGFSPAGLLSSLSGSLRLLVRDGALAGVDLAHLAAALRGGDMDDKTADKAVRAALSGGSMGFDRLEVAGSLARGDLRFDQARLHAPSGTIDITGGLNLPDLSADVRLALHPAVQSPPDPPMPDPPTLGLRVTGKLAAPLRAPELADLIRWRAARRK